jgi:type IV pilus assembly protein PilM
VETEALIDIGARVTNVVVHSAGSPRFVRILLMGGQDITDAVADRLGISVAEAEALKQTAAHTGSSEDLAAVNKALTATAQEFVDEIRNSLDYYAASTPGVPLERILLSGGGSRLDGLAERLSAATRLPVVAGDPLASLKIGRTGLDDDQLAFVRPLAAVPVGLALGAM